MVLLVISAGYVSLHFAVYALAGRHFTAWHTERGIFTWHAISYALAQLAVGLTVFTRTPGDTLVLALLVAALHGIYSLSFLEIWSLTQGSYSLQLLDQIATQGTAVSAEQLSGAQAIGALKQQDRATALERLGLMRGDGSLSVIGRPVALGLRTILWISNGRPLN